jgi:hypothetical protein
MTNKTFTRLGLMLALAISAAACDRATVHEDVQAAKHTANDVAAKTDQALDDAKRGASHAADGLPTSDDIKHGINQAGDDIKSAAKTVERKALEARQNIRNDLANSK